MIHRLAQSVTNLRWRALLCVLCGLLWVGQASAMSSAPAPADCEGMTTMAEMDHHAPDHQMPADCCDSGSCAMAHCGAPASASGARSFLISDSGFRPDFSYRFSLAVAPQLRLYRPPIFS